ncbi:MAG: hypothetical protein AB7Q00_04770 [Phycisphaerales bacterium]
MISGDGRVISIGTSGALAPPRLYYDDGTTRDLPNLTLAGQERQGFVTHLNHDGSVAMLAAGFDRPGEGRKTSYRWTESGGTQIPPFPLGGSTWNQTNGMSSDGSIVVGNWAPSSLSTDMPWVWEDGGSALTPVVLPDGTPVNLGLLTTVSGDGRTTFLRYDGPPAGGRFMIHDGVATPYEYMSPLGGALSLPTGASYDGSVLVGSLGGNNGSWIWTQETGAMRAADFFRLRGIILPDGSRIDNLIVSGDGLHFGGQAGIPGSESGGFVATIPAPGAVVSLILVGIGATGRRRRR